MAWAHVPYQDNAETVDLIEARPPAGVGLLSVLDEECVFPKGSDASFAAKLHAVAGGHPRFGAPARAGGGSGSGGSAAGGEFTLRHYAGDVVYCCDRFLDKNRDSLSPDLAALLRASSAPLAAAALAPEPDRRGGGAATVGSRFREQLRDLIQSLDA